MRRPWWTSQPPLLAFPGQAHRKIASMLTPTIVGLLSVLSVGNAPAGEATAVEAAPRPLERTYHVRQTVHLEHIDPEAKQVRWWVSIPDNERHQDLLDVSVVDAPGTWTVERAEDHPGRFLYMVVDNPKAASLEAVVEFTLRRQSVQMNVDPEQVGPITPEHRRIFAEDLVLDAPNMVVTPPIKRMADEVCGDETNPAKKSRLLLAHVANIANHYSIDETVPTCGIGNASDCLTNLGGCCTDLHSLFISLSRAAGIPARLQMGYRLNEKKAGTTYDPGYRCWVEYFLPGVGWTPADIVEADAPGGLGPERWFTGLTEWRLWLNQGREFQLKPTQAQGPVNTMIIGYAEVDGVPARVLDDGDDKPAQLRREIQFELID